MPLSRDPASEDMKTRGQGVLTAWPVLCVCVMVRCTQRTTDKRWLKDGPGLRGGGGRPLCGVEFVQVVGAWQRGRAAALQHAGFFGEPKDGTTRKD